MNNKSQGQYLDVLQIFRGVAALMVLFCHTTGSIKYYHKIGYSFLNNIASIAKYGVDFFFILSGFIITYSSFNKYNEPNSLSNYIKNRLIRIYVPYLPIGIFMFMIYVLFPDFSNSNRSISILTSLTLIPEGNPALSVAWTLSYELCFYLLFSISFFSKEVWNYFVFVWITSIVVFNYTSFLSFELLKNPLFKILFSTYNIEFILGFLLALVILRKIKINLFLVFSALILSFSILLYYVFNHFNFFTFGGNFIFSIFAFLLIYATISNFDFKINSTALMMLVGNATYSIYLIHNPLQMILIRLFPKISSLSSLICAIILVSIISCVVGYYYYLIFEKKAIQFVKYKLINRT